MKYKLLAAETLPALTELLDEFQKANYVLHEYAGKDVRPNLIHPASNLYCVEFWYEPEDA